MKDYNSYKDWKLIKQSTPFTRPSNHVQPHLLYISKHPVDGHHRLRSITWYPNTRTTPDSPPNNKDFIAQEKSVKQAFKTSETKDNDRPRYNKVEQTRIP